MNNENFKDYDGDEFFKSSKPLFKPRRVVTVLVTILSSGLIKFSRSKASFKDSILCFAELRASKVPGFPKINFISSPTTLSTLFFKGFIGFSCKHSPLQSLTSQPTESCACEQNLCQAQYTTSRINTYPDFTC
ncbi:hypothetical protein GQX74_013786 [Glossina fuscipes]|nr:hypothetical protein GQX74_013786 [Glossina fuscipes]